MTLTDAKKKYGLDEVTMRFLINSNFKRGRDYIMDTVGRRWVLFFTVRGQNQLPFLVEKFKKEHVC